MRIIAGKYRHQEIKYPKDELTVRPTKDRVREAIFSALGDINDAIVLDLYAGSGSLGLESLSRGSKKVYFNDKNIKCTNIIKSNIKTLGISEEQYEITNFLDISFLSFIKNKNIKFNLIFLDPPYKEGKYEEIVNSLINSDLVSSKAIFVLESDRKINIQVEEFKKVKEYKYGEIRVTILYK